jgi:hypothetical protein
MDLEVLNAVTIYEVNGTKYMGPRKVYIKKHPRFLSVVRLSIDGQEYSLASDDLLCAIERAIAQVPARDADSTEADQRHAAGRHPRGVANDDQIVDPRPL